MSLNNQGSPVLRFSGVRYAIDDRVILDAVDLEVHKGQSVAVTGPSGSGKTTLLMCALGLIRPAAGAVFVAGTDITGLRPRALAAHRRAHLGMVFQFGELLPELSPVENVALAAQLCGIHHRTAYAAAERLLKELGVSSAATSTGLLSGGERQRTAVARALITEPTVLLADEPTGALDHDTRESVADLLFAVPRERDCALVVVTHDQAVAERSDRELRIDAGQLTGASA